MIEQAKKKPSKVLDGILVLCVFVLFAFAVLISGGGRAIADTLAQRSASASFVEGESEDDDCPPCEKARRAKIEAARVQAQAVSEKTPLDGQDSEDGSEDDG